MNLGKKDLGYHFNRYFVGCFIYVDDITFFYRTYNTLHDKDVQFMGNPILYVLLINVNL